MKFYVINCDCQAKLKDAGFDCVEDVIDAEKYYKEKCKRLEKELIRSVANATYGIPILEENDKYRNELKEIKTKLKDAGWDCVNDVINAEKEYEEKYKSQNELNTALKMTVNAIYGKHTFEHFIKIEEKCEKLEDKLKHYYELNGLVAKFGFNNIEELVTDYRNLKTRLRVVASLVDEQNPVPKVDTIINNKGE